MVEHLEKLFPGLQGKAYQVTSLRTKQYNCIAWATGDVQAWWWPLGDETVYWPAGVALEVTLQAFLAAFATLGYVVGDREDPEPGFEKVALFLDASGEPTHAARQLSSGRWTSKIGRLEDIVHDLRDLEGAEYGTVAHILRRPLSQPA